MQTILIPDYLKGIHFPNDKWEVLYHTIDWWKKNCSYTGNSIYIGNGPLASLLKQDVSLRSFLLAYSIYDDNKGKNYVIGKNLAKALFHTKKDVRCKRLPNEFFGFIYLPNLKDEEGYEVLGAFCSILNKELRIGFISKDVIPGFLALKLDDDTTVADIQVKNAHHKAIFDPNSLVPKYYTEENSPKWEDLGVLLNAIIYIANSDEKLVEEINQFSTKKNKVATEKKIYTSLPFIRVGFNFHLPHTFTVDSTLVRGHWRFQPCGPERAYIKHIYIEPHERNYNNV